MTNPLVQLDMVGFSYQADMPVLTRCNLTLRPGDRVGLVGANGSGKSSLLALIVGLIAPTTGRIEAFGKDRVCESDFHEVRRRVGLLFQDSDDQLFCPTVAEDVAFGPLNLGMARDEVCRTVAQTLDSLGLSGYADRITYKLSGGEKRLVALATVLAMRPDVLLLDEPTAGLDESTTDRVMEILAKLPQAMLLVSHDRRILERLVNATLRFSRDRSSGGSTLV